jgi:hypothetical protein
MRQSASQWVARIGYAARGLVFILVGFLSGLAALGSGGRPVGTKGALQSLLGQPFGRVLLLLIAAGLLCFAAWRAMQAVLDADRLGGQRRGLVRRATYGLGTLIYLGLAGSALALARGKRSGGDDQTPRDGTAWLLGLPGGRWLVGAVGLAIVGAAFASLWRALRHDFRTDQKLGPGTPRGVIIMGRVGLVARGVVFLLVGTFVMFAAIAFDPREAVGLAGALRNLQQQPFGWVLLLAVAIGLTAFGAFQLGLARYRRVDMPKIGT